MPLEVDNINQQNGTFFYQKIQDNSSATLLPVIDQFEVVNGSRIDIELNNFLVVGSGLKYTGTQPFKIFFSGHVTWEAGGTLNANYKIGLFKNEEIQGKVEGTLDNSNAWPRNVSFGGIVELIENDIIQVRTANETNDQEVLIIDLLFYGTSI